MSAPADTDGRELNAAFDTENTETQRTQRNFGIRDFALSELHPPNHLSNSLARASIPQPERGWRCQWIPNTSMRSRCCARCLGRRPRLVQQRRLAPDAD